MRALHEYVSTSRVDRPFFGLVDLAAFAHVDLSNCVLFAALDGDDAAKQLAQRLVALDRCGREEADAVAG